MKVKLIHSASDPVRLAYESLFTKRTFVGKDGNSEPRFEGTFIIKPGGANAKRVQEGIKAVAEEKYGDGWAKMYKAWGDDQKGLRDGNTKPDSEGFEDMLFIASSNKTRPGVFNRDTSPLAQEDGVIYSGCYVNAEVDIWALNKPQVKKRIVADLLGVQFVSDGDAFSAGSAPSKSDSFSDLSADGDEDQGGASADGSDADDPFG